MKIFFIILFFVLGIFFAEAQEHSSDSLSEKYYLQARDNYRYQLKDTARADSIEKIILEKFPRGEAARFNRHNELVRQAKQDKLIENAETFLQEFPVGEWRQLPEQRNQEFLYYTTYRSLIEGLMGTKQFDKTCDYADQMYFKALNETYRWNIEGLLKIPHFDFTDRYPVANAFIRQMILKKGDGTMDGMGTDKADELAQAQLNARLSAHIRMLDRLGKYQEAREFVLHIAPEQRYSDPDLNEAHLHILEQSGTPREVRELLENSVRANATTSGMLEKMEQLYISDNGSAQGYFEYLKKFKSQEELEAIRQEIQKQLIAVPYEAFSLEDNNGKWIKSQKWKDKIVILDFWGTWCFPCIKSFPGMQMAVEQYANDRKVEFCFVATDDEVKNVEKFIAKNNYPFHWLYDLETGKNKNPGAVYTYFRKLLNVSGVPCKIAIKNGKVRYVSVGYGGSPSRLADELSILIELLKEE